VVRVTAGTTLRVRRRDGGTIVIAAGGLTRAFFGAPIVDRFEEVAGTTARDAITPRDLEYLNSLMGARSPHALWQPVLGPQRWLRRIDPELDLIGTSERTWRARNGDELVRDALDACIAPGRKAAAATKLLHLKRPRLFPMLDRFVIELMGPRRGVGDDADDAVDLVLHLRAEGRANADALKTIQRDLRERGTNVALVRILDAALWSSHPAAGSIGGRPRVFRTSLS
jgi:hypothetical protein